MPLIIGGYLTLDIREIRRHVGHRLDVTDDPPALACRTCEQTIAAYIEPRPTYRCGACDTAAEHREGVRAQRVLRRDHHIPAEACVGCYLGDDGPSMHDCYIHRLSPMAKFEPPYGAKVYSIPYIPTVFEGREAVQYCPSCNQRVVLRRLKDFESFTGEEMEAHIEARHPGLIKEI